MPHKIHMYIQVTHLSNHTVFSTFPEYGLLFGNWAWPWLGASKFRDILGWLGIGLGASKFRERLGWLVYNQLQFYDGWSNTRLSDCQRPACIVHWPPLPLSILCLCLSLSLSLSLSLRLSLSLSYRGHQWIVRVMSFRNMYGYMGL